MQLTKDTSKQKDTEKSKLKEWKKMYQATVDQNKVEIAILMPIKKDFKPKDIRDKYRH